MSRIGKLPIPLPAGVTAKLDGPVLTVAGPKGELHLTVHRLVSVAVTPTEITVTVNDANEQSQRALWGLTRMLIANMVTGITAGYSKKLEINGVGFKAALAGQTLNLNLGFSHPIVFPIPVGITIAVEKNVVTVSGIDKQLVGETAATIRRLKKPEPYKGKGIKYSDEVIRRKAGKVVKAAGAK
ncbi:MAG: 50S ribosomal protein L6 [Candidatus Kerfeldbacteria bacterium]|nr:50S ribosomal protein L6 [Candidatus Kerfeldbacteria bacterium]